MAMGAPVANDRHLAANVRRKILKAMEDILDNGTKKEQKEIVFKMGAQTLPRLTEVSGVDGEAIAISISREASDKLEATVASPTSITAALPSETIKGS